MMRSSEEVLPRMDQRPGMVTRFWDSTVGKKTVMAVTGAIGLGYLIAHAIGNLLVFRGAAKINAYAGFLKSNLGLLWVARNTSRRGHCAHSGGISTGPHQPEQQAR